MAGPEPLGHPNTFRPEDDHAKPDSCSTDFPFLGNSCKHHTSSCLLDNHVARSRRVWSPFSQLYSSKRRTLNDNTPHACVWSSGMAVVPRPKENTNMNDGHVATSTNSGNAARIHRNDTTRQITPAARSIQPNPYVNPNGANHGNHEGDTRTANSPTNTSTTPGRVSRLAESTRRRDRLGFLETFEGLDCATVNFGFRQTRIASPRRTSGRSHAWRSCPKWRPTAPGGLHVPR